MLCLHQTARLGKLEPVGQGNPNLAYGLLGAKDSLRAVHPDAAHDFPQEIRGQAYEFLEKALGK